MLNKNCISKITSIVLCICIVVVASLTHIIIVENLSHHCDNNKCDTCLFIENMITNLEGKSINSIGVSDVIILSFFIIQATINFVLYLKQETLITKKVCLIN